MDRDETPLSREEVNEELANYQAMIQKAPETNEESPTTAYHIPTGQEGILVYRMQSGDTVIVNPSWNGSNPRGNLFDSVEINVSDEFTACFFLAVFVDDLSLDAIHSYVDHNRAWFDHIGSDKLRLANGCDDDIRFPDYFRKVFGSTVTYRNRGVSAKSLLEEEEPHRFADDVASTDNNDALSLCFYVITRQKSLNPIRGTG